MRTKANKRERLQLLVLHLLRIAEGLVYVFSFSLLNPEWSTKWLFSDFCNN